MVVYWIMFVYTVTVSFVIESENKQRKYVLKNQNKNTALRTTGMLGALLAFAAIIIFTGIRGYVADTTAYIIAFENETRTLADVPILFTDIANVKGPLWQTLQIIVKSYIYDDVTVLFVIVAFFQGFAVAKTFSMYSEYFTFSSYLFMASYSFFWMINGTRQFTAVCIILLASKYLFNKQFKWYLLWVAVACCFHTTALLCAVVCFIVQGEPFNKRIMGTTIAVFLSIAFVDQFTGFIDSALEDTLYNGAANEYSGEGGMSPFVTLMNMAPVALVWWRRKIIFSMERPRYIDVIINLSCVTVGICLVANFTSGITFGRLPIYFTLYNYILLPWVIEKTFNGAERMLIRALCILFYILYFLYQAYGADSGGGEYSSFYWKFLYENFSIKLFDA